MGSEMCIRDSILTEKCECQFFLPRAGTISSEFIQDFLKNASPRLDIIVTAGRIYDLMRICTACIASSGTATLETALMGLPTVLVYRLSAITWFLAKHLVRVGDAGLPNILLHKEVTPELLQDKVTAGNIAEVVLPWLTDEVKRQENIRELKSCLLYTSDAADEEDSVDLGSHRIIKKKK